MHLPRAESDLLQVQRLGLHRRYRQRNQPGHAAAPRQATERPQVTEGHMPPLSEAFWTVKKAGAAYRQGSRKRRAKYLKLSPACLWIGRLVHALTVTPCQVVHALTVTLSRINGDAPNYILYFLYLKTPVAEAAQRRGQPCGLTTASAAPNTRVRSRHEPQNKLAYSDLPRARDDARSDRAEQAEAGTATTLRPAIARTGGAVEG